MGLKSSFVHYWLCESDPLLSLSLILQEWIIPVLWNCWDNEVRIYVKGFGNKQMLVTAPYATSQVKTSFNSSSENYYSAIRIFSYLFKITFASCKMFFNFPFWISKKRWQSMLLITVLKWVDTASTGHMFKNLF